MSEAERLRRWRLVLGGGAAEGTGCTLSERDGRLDRAMGALYDSDRKGGLGPPPRPSRAGSATSATTSRLPWCR
ncbi:hypothetical protein GCM10025880_44730 [Methylorubrum aminovorans]|nr:hypothetical protein GCM10025880_44730 [Methylorubrum aminovorans]